MDQGTSTLLEFEAIKQLKARYFRLMDTKEWSAFEEVFAEEATIDVSDDAGEANGHVRGARKIANYIRAAVGEAQTVHHGHMPELRLLDATSAEGTWAMFDYVEFPSPDKRIGLRGYGHYLETYEKQNGEWRITSMKLARLRVDPLS